MRWVDDCLFSIEQERAKFASNATLIFKYGTMEQQGS